MAVGRQDSPRPNQVKADEAPAVQAYVGPHRGNLPSGLVQINLIRTNAGLSTFAIFMGKLIMTGSGMPLEGSPFRNLIMARS